MSTKKVLIILSDAHTFDVKMADGTVKQEETGFFLMELAKPLKMLLDDGYEVEFASPSGKAPSIDPLSNSLFAFVGNYWEQQRENKLIEQMKVEKNLDAPTPFSQITDEKLATYNGIFIPGGHAPLSLDHDAELGRIIMHFHNKQKPTATVCHGPFALLSTRSAPQSTGFAYKGYKISSWSDAEEKLVETLKGGEITKTAGTLAENGAIMVEGMAEKLGYITVDRELISGGNPMALNPLGEKFIEMMKQQS